MRTTAAPLVRPGSSTIAWYARPIRSGRGSRKPSAQTTSALHPRVHRRRDRVVRTAARSPRSGRRRRGRTGAGCETCSGGRYRSRAHLQAPAPRHLLRLATTRASAMSRGSRRTPPQVVRRSPNRSRNGIPASSDATAGSSPLHFSAATSTYRRLKRQNASRRVEVCSELSVIAQRNTARRQPPTSGRPRSSCHAAQTRSRPTCRRGSRSTR